MSKMYPLPELEISKLSVWNKGSFWNKGNGGITGPHSPVTDVTVGGSCARADMYSGSITQEQYLDQKDYYAPITIGFDTLLIVLGESHEDADSRATYVLELLKLGYEAKQKMQT